MTADGTTSYIDGTGTLDNDTVIEFAQNVEAFNTFLLHSTAGAMDVVVCIDDGTNYTTAALSLTDLGANTTDPVLVTAAGRLYGFKGKFKKIKVLQNGATAVENASLRYGVM